MWIHKKRIITYVSSLYFVYYIQTEHFLLSEHILCKESIAIVKKLDFEILFYLNVLRSPEFIYAIFKVMYVRMCVCVSVCMCVCE